MGFLYATVKSIWRATAPRSLNYIVFSGQSKFSRAILKLKGALENTANHDELYDAEYYQSHESLLEVSSAAIVASLIEHFSPTSVIDVGCGSGAILNRFRDQNIAGIGLEYSQAALRICQDKGLDVRKFDIESASSVELGPADLVLSTEVAEHLPESRADRYVDLLVELSRRHIVMTAATPGQGGTDHVNEQPNSYWIEKFAHRGAEFQQDLTASLRTEWKNRGVDSHRSTNLLIFEKNTVRIPS
jgi:cyclopropane fatty-acyl-phospholipid synthase-like methyltransferase